MIKPPQVLALEEEIGQEVLLIPEKNNLQVLDLSNPLVVAVYNSTNEIITVALFECNLLKIPENLLKFSTLKVLILNRNKIIDLSPLRGMDKLQKLQFNLNQVSDLSPLAGLQNLYELRFDYNQVSDLSPLSGMDKLHALYVNCNKVSDLSPLSGMDKLHTLYFDSNKVSDLSPLSEIYELKELNFDYNEVSDILPLKGLKKLTNLYFGSNQISDLSPIAEVDELQSLSLSCNLVGDISPLSGMNKLQYLDFSFNHISDISPLSGMNELDTLHFESNMVHDISPLTGMNKLEDLNFSSNQVNDISPLTEINKLDELRFSSNLVSDISPLSGKDKLKSLNFSSNQVRNLSPLSEITQLLELNFSSNQVSDLSPLTGIDKLEELNFSSNQVSDLAPLEKMQNLRTLDFGENLISDISILLNLPNLYSPPKELLLQGAEAVLNEFKQKDKQGVDLLFEAKALVIGEGGVGKTSFCRRFFDSDEDLPEEEDSTEGADVQTFNFDIVPKALLELNEKSIPENGYDGNIQKQKEYLLHFWDFAGQKRYLPTHVFFFSERSVYVLVTDNRYESRDLRYWLHLVGQIAGNSKVILIINKKDGKPSSLDVEELKRDFKHLEITAFESDISANEKRALIIEQVLYHAKTLKHIGETVPAYWVAVRNYLASWSGKTMSRKEFYQLCNYNGIEEEEDIRLLANYFHEIGVFLFYQKDDITSRLKDIVFLDKNWTLDAVYKVLDAKPVIDQKGRFTSQQANQLWSENCYSEIRGELLELLQEFGLVYPLGSNEYIVPEHLPQERPKLNWDNKDCQRIQYRFEHFMPRGLISRLTVALYNLIEDQNKVWKYGVVLKRNNTSALVTETYDGAGGIEIKLSGSHKQDMRVTITDALEKILEPFRYLEYQLLIPCNCEVCKGSDSPHFFDYQQLLNYLEVDRKYKDCEKTPFNAVHIPTLIRDNYGIEQDFQQKEATLEAKKMKKKTIFVSYSHHEEDQMYFDEIVRQLETLPNCGIDCEIWTDQQIQTGDDWFVEIKKALEKTKVGVLLISQNFLRSDFIKKEEIPDLFDKVENEGGKIMPVILRKTVLDIHPVLKKFQAANSPDAPLVNMSQGERDNVYTTLLRDIICFFDR